MKGAGVGAAVVDDRDLVEVVRLVDHAAAVGVGAAPLVARRARCGVGLRVDVPAADLRVEVDELRGVIRPACSASRPYWMPALPNGWPAKPARPLLHVRPHALRARAEHVDHEVQDRAAHAAGLRLRVVRVGRREHAVAAGSVWSPLNSESSSAIDRVHGVRVALDRPPSAPAATARPAPHFAGFSK